ncbi:MAG TPA: hypothetical protein VFG15_30315 [Amycolatopsis sp.]|nr:hypothetical protein [Amycolatopsis sp.]
MGATSRYGWNYPEIGDPPNTAAHLRALAESVEATLGVLDDKLTVLSGIAFRRIAGSIRTANVGPGTFTTETFIQTVTFSAQAGRRYRITMDYQNVASDTTYFTMRGRWAAGPSVTPAGTQFYYRDTSAGSPGNWEGPLTVTAEVTGLPAGQITAGFSVIRTGGTGTADYRAAPTQPAYVWVDDVAAA